MSNEPQETTLSDYLGVLRRRRRFIATVAILCALAALGFSALQTASYSAQSSVSVRDQNADLGLLGAGFVSGGTPLQTASVHAPQVTRDSVVKRVKRELRSPLTVDQLRSRVTVEIDPNSYVVKITATDGTAAGAAAIANAFAEQDAAVTRSETRRDFAAAAKTLQAKLKKKDKAAKKAIKNKTLDSSADPTARAILVDQLSRVQSLAAVADPISISQSARAPSSPSSPKPVRNTIAALIFGLFLGIALAYARSALDHRLRSIADVETLFDHPLVGHVRSQALGHASFGAAAPGEPLGPQDQESFRILRHNVRYLAAGDGLQSLVVTSAMAQEGKSTVSACLAIASAAAGKRTLLIDCDLRRPVVADRFGLAASPGLTDYLTGNAEPQDIIQAVPAIPSDAGDEEATALVCITAGTPVPRPADLLGSERFRAFLAEVGEVYDQIILDSAPLLTVADTLEIIPEVSGVLLCVRLEQTTRDQAKAAQAALERLPQRPTGIVLTDVKDTGEGYYGYYDAPAQAVGKS